jgi:hypothetical protein
VRGFYHDAELEIHFQAAADAQNHLGKPMKNQINIQRRGYFHFIPGILLVFVIFCSSPAFAQYASDDPRFKDVWQKSQELRDQPSVDATPVEFTYLGAKYRVPRNYIVHMAGPLTPPTFRVTYPGFEPLTEKTRQCLTKPRAYWPPGCIPIEFWLGGQTHFTDDDHFNNARDLFHSQTPKEGPGGLELYEEGSIDHLAQIYRKKTSTHTLLITCFYYDTEKRGALCTNYSSPLPNGNDLSYRIDLNQLENAEKIDDGIRALINSFTLKGDNKP